MFDTGSWQSFEINVNGAVSWGEFMDGTGYINNDDVTLNSQYAPYVVGSIPDTIPTGMLNFSLDGATVARAYASDGTSLDTGTLTQFNLGINLGSSAYTLDMQLDMNTMGTYSMNNSGTLSSGSGSTFQISDVVSNTGGSNCSACPITVDGFLAGPNANQAGVVYDIQDGTDRITGAAGLTDGTPPANLGI